MSSDSWTGQFFDQIREHEAQRPQAAPSTRYEWRREIGRGGMAVVYEAQDRELHRTVAIKTLREDVALQRTSLERFRREARVASGLSHPALVTVYDVGEDAGRPFIVMELVEGESLDLYWRKHCPSVRTRIELLEKAARGVACAHEHGIVHRDLKPGNILVDAKGQPKVTDFGLAHLTESTSPLTQTGVALGTPQFMAPEQVQGRLKEISPRTDVYALGVILYEMLALVLPHRGGTPMEIFGNILHRDPVTPRVRDSQIPRAAETICLKAMEKAPSRRYATAREFADDLRRFLDDLPILARPPSLAYRIRMRLTRGRGPLLAASGAALLAAVAVGLTMRYVSRAREFEESRARAQRAYQAEDWPRAQSESERALRSRWDPSLAAIAAESHRKQLAEKQEGERRRIESDRYKRLQEERIKPLLTKIQEARLYFYLRESPLWSKLSEVSAELADLERLAESPDYRGMADVWITLGTGWYFVAQPDRAERALLRAEELAPRNERVAVSLGKICLDRWFATLVSLSGHLQRKKGMAAHQTWARKAADYFARARRPGESPESLESYLEAAYRACADRDEKAVLETARRGLERYPGIPGNEELWFLIGEYTEGRESIEAFARAIELRANFWWAFLMRSARHYNAKDFVRAEEDLNEAVRIHPRFALALLLRARLYERRGRPDLALEDLNKAVQFNSSEPGYWNERGSLRHRMRDHAGSVDDLTQAIRLSPDLVEAYYNRALARLKLREYAAALADCNEAIRLDPDEPDVWRCRGQARLSLHDLDGSERDFTESIRLGGKAESYGDRGVTREHKRDFDGALADYSEAIRLDPSLYKSWYNRGALRYRLGQSEAALADLKEALARAPEGWSDRPKAEKLVRRLEE